MLSTGISGLYIGSYVGIAPIDDPEIAVFVMLDEPMSGRYYGSAISAPVASKIMADILPYLGYEPQYTEEELSKISVSVPDATGIEIETARDRITSAGLAYKVVGNGTTVLRQLPKAGDSVYNGGTVILYTDDVENSTTTVPDLTGLTATEANLAAAKAGINIEFSGDTSSSNLKSYSQSVPAGETVPMGHIVTVSFRNEGEADLAD